jgi:ribosome-associated protein
VFDAFEIMIHLFTAENRARYRLDLLWKDATDVAVTALLTEGIRPRRLRKTTYLSGQQVK